MAKIIKVASSTGTPHIANQFKTSRNSTTNPFKYQNFEGNTLDISAFADVFESTASKETSKMKLIASSVAGSMHKIKSSITEPIVNFVNRVRSGIASAWDYAKNTNVSDLGAVKGINNIMNAKIEIPGLRAVDEYLHKPIDLSGMAIGYGAVKENVVELGKGIGAKWNALISGIHAGKNITAEMPVGELEELWKAEISAPKLEEVA